MPIGRTTVRIVALLCVAAVIASLAPIGHGLPAAVLTPFWIFLAVLVSLALNPSEEIEAAVPVSCTAAVRDRAPPAN